MLLLLGLVQGKAMRFVKKSTELIFQQQDSTDADVKVSTPHDIDLSRAML